MFCQVLRFYRLTDEGVLKMPIRRFWLLYGSIKKLVAQEEIGQGMVAMLANPNMDGDTIDKFFSQRWDIIEGDKPKIILDPMIEAEFDRAGYSRLKVMGGKAR